MPFSKLDSVVPIPDKRDFPHTLVTVGDHLKSARLQKGILIKEVIQALQVDRATLTAWENNIYAPFPKHFPKIIAFLGYFPFENEIDTIAGKIRKCRLFLGLTQEEFAAKVKVNRCSIMYWESGARVPKAETLKKLEKVFKSMHSYFHSF